MLVRVCIEVCDLFFFNVVCKCSGILHPHPMIDGMELPNYIKSCCLVWMFDLIVYLSLLLLISSLNLNTLVPSFCYTT